MIPQSTIDQILQTAVIEEVVADYVELKKSGSTFRGLSPFSNEKTPSFYVVPAKGIFKDFSSGKGGSLVTFLMEVEKVSYPEALRMLAKRYNIEIEEEQMSEERRAEMTERESLAAVVAWAGGWFAENLFETEEGQAIGLSYFEQRGFRRDILKRFGIGYCPEAWSSMSEAAVAAGYSEDRLVAVGLSKRRESDGSLWDFFKGRVMFPIRDVSGRVIAFGGRTLRTDKSIAKYFNSPESALYHKGDVLYGIDLARPEIAKVDRVFLVEGYTDVMAMHQAGVANVVASSGTALTEGQIRLIRRFTHNITVLFDGDAAGIRASLRGIDLLLAAGMDVRVVLFPDGDDPDSYSRKVSSEELQRHIDEGSQDFLAFKIDLLSQDIGDDPIRRAGMIHSIVESVASIPDTIKRGVYLQSSAAALGLAEDLLTGEVNKVLQKRIVEARRAEERKERMSIRRGGGSSVPGRTSGSAGPPSPGGPPPPPEPGQYGGAGFQDDHAPPPPDDEFYGGGGGDTGAAPGLAPDQESVAPLQGWGEPEHVEQRRILERDLIRLLLRHGGTEVHVHPEEGDEVLGVEFAELVLHHLAESAVKFVDPPSAVIRTVFEEKLAEGELPDLASMAAHKDPSVAQLVAESLIDRHQVSDRWETSHGIHHTREEDVLELALLKSLHRLLLNENRHEMERVLAEIQDLGHDAPAEQLEVLLRQKQALDADKKHRAAYFGVAIVG